MSTAFVATSRIESILQNSSLKTKPHPEHLFLQIL